MPEARPDLRTAILTQTQRLPKQKVTLSVLVAVRCHLYLLSRHGTTLLMDVHKQELGATPRRTTGALPK